MLASNAPWYDKVWAAANLGILFIPGANVEAYTAELVAKGISKDVAEKLAPEVAGTVRAIGRLGCGCFPAATRVATPKGPVAIASLKAGDLVLAEDPATGRVEPEPVRAVLDDGVKPTMRVGLGDGTGLQVTTNHPFYVDGGPGIATASWIQAGDLRLGDRIRTADGQDVAVAALRYATGPAHVYTLTVATDHDFFVGTARVLVHNCDPPVVADSYLARQVGALWRAHGEGEAVVGDGSAFDALINEAATGLPTGGKFHDQKIDDAISGLRRWLAQNPTSPDRDAAQSLLTRGEVALQEWKASAFSHVVDGVSQLTGRTIRN